MDTDLRAPGTNGALAPPYNQPPVVPASGNLSAEAQANLDQINANVAAGQLREYNGSFASDYMYYLFNPSKMDSSLATASSAAWSVAGIAGGGAVGIVGGTAIAAGLEGATVFGFTISCPVATFAGSLAGSQIASSVGGWIGSWGGSTSQTIASIGAGILGGFTGGQCFAAGTQVVVGVNSDGTYVTKNIEDIQVGDYVLTRPQDDPNAPLEYKQVLAVYVHQVTQEQLLTVVDAQGNTETITCTIEHPFWVPGQGWTAAGELTPGTELTSPDGSMVMVVSNSVQVLAQPVNVYNFEVAGDHTYFVDQGGEPVWVHNACSTTSGNNAAASAGKLAHQVYSGVMKQLGLKPHFCSP